MNRNGLLIFAREPVPGKVKTRLGSSIGFQSACDLYISFLYEVAKKIPKNTDLIVFFHSGSKPNQELEKTGKTNSESVPPVPQILLEIFQNARCFVPQVKGDLGKKMETAFFWAFNQGYKKVIITGTDSPDLPLTYIERGFEFLTQNPLVFGPTYDGGYYLIGAHQPPPKLLFQNIPWSTENVLNCSLEKLNEASFKYKLLNMWWDIDTEADYSQYLKRQNGGKS